jgi:hypothetical protein
VLDIASGELETIATGTILGASFAPQPPDRLVYARASIAQLDDNEASLWVARGDGWRRRRLTATGLASAPLWTARGIVFASLQRLGSETSSPLYSLWQIQPDGRGAARLAAFTAGPPASAEALSASTSGRRIVADFDAPDGGPVEVWQLALTARGVSARELTLPGLGILADGISRNGKLILVTVFGAQSQVASLSWDATHQRTLASPAGVANWND